MTERLTIHVEDGTRDRLLKLADGHERKLGAVVSELAKQAEALQALKEAFFFSLIDVLTRIDALERAVGIVTEDEDSED